MDGRTFSPMGWLETAEKQTGQASARLSWDWRTWAGGGASHYLPAATTDGSILLASPHMPCVVTCLLQRNVTP